MKRSAALAPLLRDHQHALDAALRLRRADEGTVDEALHHFGDFFDREGRRHFAIEERLVLPSLSHGDVEWSEAVRRVRADHDAIRAAAGEPAGSSRPSEAVRFARALGDRLAEHVRFEERVLFEILERRLTDDALDELGRAIEAAERADGERSPQRAGRFDQLL